METATNNSLRLTRLHAETALFHFHNFRLLKPRWAVCSASKTTDSRWKPCSTVGDM